MTSLFRDRNRAAQGELPPDEMYREWLGIKNPAPSHYGLLGLPELETDEAAVLGAGRRVKRKLRAYQIGLYRKQALELLVEVGQAVSVLTNPEKKRAYDSKLMGQWRAAVEELYETHCQGEAQDPAVLDAWLTACQLRGVPVTRLMPYLMQTLIARVGDWPPLGEHKLGLPVNLWVYRDAVVLGQCLHIGPLEKRAEAVKQAQKLLAIPEGLARLVAEEVSRAQHLFAKARIVTQGKEDGEAVLLRLGRRIRRYGGDLGSGKVLAAVARLLGKHKADLDRALAKVDESPIELSRSQAAAVAARHAREHLAEAGRWAGKGPTRLIGWAVGWPQILVGLAVLTGVMALVVALLVMAGVLQPWEPPPPRPAPAPTHGAGGQPSGAPQTPATGPQTPTPSPSPDQPTIEEGSPDWLTEFRKKYPVGGPPIPPHPGEEQPGSEVKFFGVKGDKREPGAPVEVEPARPASPRKPVPKG